MPILEIMHVKGWGPLTDERTGEVRKGLNFGYVDAANRKDTATEKGVEIISIAGDPALYDAIPSMKLPGKFNVEYGMTMKAKKDGGKQAVGTIKTLVPVKEA